MKPARDHTKPRTITTTAPVKTLVSLARQRQTELGWNNNQLAIVVDAKTKGRVSRTFVYAFMANKRPAARFSDALAVLDALGLTVTILLTKDAR